jgi:hypothetical protein
LSVVAPDTYQRSEPLHQQHHLQQEEDEQDCDSSRRPATLAHDSAHGRACSPGSVGGSRRTRRHFTTKRCRRCDTSFTSQWRTGPSGPSTYVVDATSLATSSTSTLERMNHSAPVVVGSISSFDGLTFDAYMVKTRGPPPHTCI